MFKNWETLEAKRVASWFVNHADRESGESITPLKLQKLVYYADAWFLANFDTPLIAEDFEAWAHGPVVRTVYTKYRKHGWDALPLEKSVSVSNDIDNYLVEVFEEYGQYSAKKLEKMTHSEKPWMDARGDLSPEEASSNKLSKIDMRNFYGEKIGKKSIQKL